MEDVEPKRDAPQIDRDRMGKEPAPGHQDHPQHDREDEVHRRIGPERRQGADIADRGAETQERDHGGPADGYYRDTGPAGKRRPWRRPPPRPAPSEYDAQRERLEPTEGMAPHGIGRQRAAEKMRAYDHRAPDQGRRHQGEPAPGQEHKEQWPRDIELFLECQTPQDVEGRIVRLMEQGPVRGEGEKAPRIPAGRVGDHHRDGHDHEIERPDAKGTTDPERADTCAAFAGLLLEQQRGDEEATEAEEQIDPIGSRIRDCADPWNARPLRRYREVTDEDGEERHEPEPVELR